MRVIKPSRLQEFVRAYARARKSLDIWYAVAKKAKWRNLVDLRMSFSSADEVRVTSGKTVVVFNIGGNSFRLVCAVHYDRKKVFVLRFMTHAEYSKNSWKDTL